METVPSPVPLSPFQGESKLEQVPSFTEEEVNNILEAAEKIKEHEDKKPELGPVFEKTASFHEKEIPSPLEASQFFEELKVLTEELNQNSNEYQIESLEVKSSFVDITKRNISKTSKKLEHHMKEKMMEVQNEIELMEYLHKQRVGMQKIEGAALTKRKLQPITKKEVPLESRESCSSEQILKKWEEENKIASSGRTMLYIKLIIFFGVLLFLILLWYFLF